MRGSEIKSSHFGSKWCFLCSGGLTMMIQDQIIRKSQKSQKREVKTFKNAKQKCKIALHCTAIHSSETPQLLTPDGSNMTHKDPGWLTMAQDDIPGVRGALGTGHWWPGGTRLLLTPKRVIKQQNNGPKPWFKVPKVCPDPKGMVFIHFYGIWGHLYGLQQQY